MRVLVTGGFGYLGGRIAQFLACEGHQVILGSRKKMNAPSWLSQAKTVKLDWDNEAVLESICRDVDVVLHCAGMNAQDCLEDPISALEFNGVMTARFVRASKKSRVAKFIYFSTAHVYRSPLVGSIDEGVCPSNRHPYATSHLAGENSVLFESSNTSDFTGYVLRLSNVVGAPTHKEVNCWMLVANDFCKQATLTGKIRVKSNESQYRDFVSVEYLSKVVCGLIEDNDARVPSIINVGSGVSMSILDLANMIKDSCREMKIMDPELIFLNNERGGRCEMLNYSSSYKKGDGDKDIADDIRETLSFCLQAF